MNPLVLPSKAGARVEGASAPLLLLAVPDLGKPRPLCGTGIS
jgi:hypothetical protein